MLYTGVGQRAQALRRRIIEQGGDYGRVEGAIGAEFTWVEVVERRIRLVVLSCRQR